MNAVSEELHVIDARIVLPELGVVHGNLIIRDGRVAGLTQGPVDPGDAEVIDAAGRLVLPGLIDPHIHSGLLPPLRERLEAESAFAASGGVTTMIRYFRRPESYRDLLPAQIELGEQVQYQDFAHHLVIFNRGQLAELDTYVHDFGVTSFKLYMNMRGQRDVLMDVLVDRPDEVSVADVDYDNGLLYETLRHAASLPTPVRVNVHAEDAEIVASETARIRRLGIGGLPAWHASRPPESEAVAIGTVASLARHFGASVYFPHIGSRAAIGAVAAALAEGTDCVAETGPQYVALTTESEAGVLAKVQPAVRTPEDVEAVWDALRAGTLTSLGSDHIAYVREEKAPGPVWETRPAFGGTGLILPIFLTLGVSSGRMGITDLVRVASMGPARAFGLYPRKGTLQPGSDADLVIVDTETPWTVRAADLASASDFSAYEGMGLQGRAALVLSRGRVIARYGQPVGPAGGGRYLRRGP